MTNQIILSEEQNEIIERLQKNKGIVFLTGRAGTGKTTIIREFVKTIANHIVLAPTGIAALNINGLTIHRYFKFDKAITEEKFSKTEKNDDQYKNLEYLIIDEISMVRSDLIDYVDRFLKISKRNQKPFGGVKTLLVGDLYQLPPVVDNREREFFSDKYETEYFFSTDVLTNCEYQIIELTNIYRQKDIEFIKILNSIRNNYIQPGDLEKLNTRFFPDFTPIEREFFITLCSRRSSADQINSENLSLLMSDA